MENKRSKSRYKTPWEDKTELTKNQQFIKAKYETNYAYKHPRLSETGEKEIINSVEIECCRLCNSSNIKKKGFTTNGIQRYYCDECQHYFIPTTGTIFENHKISISEWIEFLLDIFNYGSISLTSKVNKNSRTTTTYWLHKVFLLLQNWQDNIILNGDVYIDEMYYSVIKGDIEFDRNGKKLRGLSRNQYCIGVGYDGKNLIVIVEGKAKTSTNKTKKTFLSHIKANSQLIHDDEKGHKELIKLLNLKDTSYSSADLKLMSDAENPLRPINHLIDLIRQFLNSHSGFERENLQDYLNLFCFMYCGNEDKLEKVEKLLQIALCSHATLKFRTLFEKKS